jgi:hypothetical protein
MGKKKYRLIVEDQYTSFKWSYVMRRKTEEAQLVKELITWQRFKNQKFGTFIEWIILERTKE